MKFMKRIEMCTLFDGSDWMEREEWCRWYKCVCLERKRKGLVLLRENKIRTGLYTRPVTDNGKISTIISTYPKHIEIKEHHTLTGQLRDIQFGDKDVC